MATRAVQTVVTYRAWDTSANAPKTGDVANHTLRWVKDGTSSAPANAASEVDSTNAKGIYKITMTSTETDCLMGTLAGVSSTANIAIFGPQVSFEYIPNAAAGAVNGLPLSVDSSGRVDVLKVNGTSQTARDLGASVLLSTGTGTGQLDFTSGVVKANVAQWLGNAVSAAAVGIPKVDLDTIKTNPVVNAGTVTFPTTATLASTTNITAGTITTASALTTNNDKTGYTLSTAGIDAVLDRSAGVETNFTLRQALRLILSSTVAKLSGAATSTVTIRDINDTKARITATVDADGNRSAVSTDVT
jgi:hypothetical protein